VEPGDRFNLSPSKRQLLKALLEGAGEEMAPPERIPETPRNAPLPLSFSQERLWFLDRLETAGSAYNVSVAFRLGGKLDLPVLRKCLDRLIGRHEILRTTFSENGGQPVQVIHAEMQPDFRHIRLEPAVHKPVREILKDAAAEPFDLAGGPLLRVILVEENAAQCVLMFALHHIIADAWAVDLVFRELAKDYTSLLAGPEPYLQFPRLQYADYAAYERMCWERGDFQPALAYWLDRLADAPQGVDLPLDHPRPHLQRFAGGQVSIDWPLALLERLPALASELQVTLSAVLMAAYAAILFAYSRQEDLVFGIPATRRLHPDTQEMLGLFPRRERDSRARRAG